MANTLVSPGVQVTVTDESQYLPAATNSVPLIVLATAQNKLSADGSGVATGTLAANADQLFLVTSQRALSAHYGAPFFYQTTNGTPINGYELNEYGLLAAYSALGVTNQCYVLRAAIDLAALSASLTRPTGTPANGTYWLDTTNTSWGIFEWNQATGAFTNQIPLVITDTIFLQSGTSIPLSDFGSIGQYAVTATNTKNPNYFKNGAAAASQTDDVYLSSLYNSWVQVGSTDWQLSWPTVQAQNTPTSLVAGQTFLLNGVTITVPTSPYNTVRGVSDAIYAAFGGVGAGVAGVGAANIGGSLNIFASAKAASGTGIITIASGGGNPGTVLADLGLAAGTYHAPAFQASPSQTVPQWSTFSTVPEPTGSVWQKTSNVNSGTNFVIKQYNSTLGTFVSQACPVYSSDIAALYDLDPTGGGVNIPAGSTYAKSIPNNNSQSSFIIYERYIIGATVIPGTYNNAPQTFTVNDTFYITASQPGSATAAGPVLATMLGTTPAAFVAAVSAAAVPYVSASIASNGAIVLTHSAGGDIILSNGTNTSTALPSTALQNAGFTVAGYAGQNATTPFVRPNYVLGAVAGLVLSNWQSAPYFTYTASNTTPDEDPATGTYWYYSDPTQVDIMIQNNGEWVGYQTVTNDARGYNLSLTNATGPIISATPPMTQTNAAQSPLVYGDLWVNTSDLENYPMLYRWQPVNGVNQWVQIDNTDSTQSSGIIFQDARWAPNGTTDPVNDPIPPISGTGGLLTSNYLDPDAPLAELYPTGILLWNTRRSGFNVKTFQANYFNNQSFPTYDWVATTPYTVGQYVQYHGVVYACIKNTTNNIPSTSPLYWSLQEVTSTWLSATGLREDGSPYMGRQSQRKLIVDSLRAAIETNTAIREEQNYFNLIAVPGYPELAIDMEALNNEINNVAFNIVDTPLRLTPDNVVTWATNNGGLGLPTGDGNLASGDPYSATFYPSCLTTDLSGNNVATYPSHMMIRTIIRSDEVAYPWLAPAGTRRGLVDNAFQLGYVDAITGNFDTLGVGQGLRDVLYQNQVNPITFIPGVGITNFGNKTLQATATALDRINVARLVAFIRYRLEVIGKQYLFEPNDQITRTEIANSINSMMVDLVAKRGLYDYLVVCDTTNNTPTTIDQNQLWVDIAIEPVKAVEFIYIPLRIEATGAIAAQATA